MKTEMDTKTKNEKLAFWLTSKTGISYKYINGGFCSDYLSVCSSRAEIATHHMEELFTKSRDTIALIENELTPEQYKKYIRLRLKILGVEEISNWAFGYCDLIAIDKQDALTRCRALVEVLELEN